MGAAEGLLAGASCGFVKVYTVYYVVCTLYCTYSDKDIEKSVAFKEKKCFVPILVFS